MNFDYSRRQVPVPSFQDETMPGAANAHQDNGNGSTVPPTTFPPATPTVALSPSHDLDVPLPQDFSRYDLTVNEALDVFTAQERKLPSTRTLQRYCQERRFDCFKLKTTRNGKPVHEWIINSTSLLEFVASRPRASAPDDTAMPTSLGDAKAPVKSELNVQEGRNDMASPALIDDANDEHGLPRSVANPDDDMASPVQNNDAEISQESRVALLVENARLTARLDSQEDLIGELREDKEFMRDQITHQRGNDTLMADMHRETFHTLKAVSVAGRHTRIEMPPQASDHHEEADTGDEQRPGRGPFDGV